MTQKPTFPFRISTFTIFFLLGTIFSRILQTGSSKCVRLVTEGVCTSHVTFAEEPRVPLEEQKHAQKTGVETKQLWFMFRIRKQGDVCWCVVSLRSLVPPQATAKPALCHRGLLPAACRPQLAGDIGGVPGRAGGRLCSLLTRR